MAHLPWLQARMRGEITADRRIILNSSEHRIMDPPRPERVEESGANPEMLRKIQAREPGQINTLGYVGGAIAQIVPFHALSLLEPKLMAKLVVKYGAWEDTAYLAMVRTTSGSYIWNCAEPSGGMADTPILQLEQLKEGVELGIFKKDGWLQFLLPNSLREYQAEFDQEQTFWWNIVRPGFPRAYSAPIEFLPVGNDSWDGRPGIINAGDIGNIQVVNTARIHLQGTGWQFVDTESRPGNPAKEEPEWVALRRKVMAIVPRPGRTPLMLELDSEGRLHPGGLHVAIEGENRGYVISYLSEAVLQALGWLK